MVHADHRASFRRGVRLGVPFAAVGLLLSSSFGVLAVQAGFSPLQALVMSALVHAGAAQFAATSIVVAGGGVVSGVVAATVMNARFLQRGAALAPSLPGGPALRAVQAQTVVDPSWAVANNGDGTFDRWLLFGATAPQYVGWISGTLLGAYGGDLIGDIERFGLDAVYPTARRRAAPTGVAWHRAGRGRDRAGPGAVRARRHPDPGGRRRSAGRTGPVTAA